MKRVLLILTVFVVVFFTTSCKKTNSIVGTWESDLGLIYTFNADGTGTYNIIESTLKFTYKIEDNTISILYESDTIPYKAEFSIKNDILEFSDDDYFYRRK